MKKKVLLSFLFIFISGSLLFAQNQFTGHWTGKVMDQYEIANDFVAKGDSLTGKTIHYDGSSSDITNGKIMGDSISYDINFNGETIHVQGHLKGDTLAAFFNYQGNDMSVDLKKVPAEAAKP
jgi:hypothetical protein